MLPSIIPETKEASYKEEWEMRESCISCKVDDDLCPDNLCISYILHGSLAGDPVPKEV